MEMNDIKNKDESSILQENSNLKNSGRRDGEKDMQDRTETPDEANNIQTKQCPHCKKFMPCGVENFLRHTKACEIYFKYILTVPYGYKCLICLDSVVKDRSSMYVHLKKCKEEMIQNLDNSKGGFLFKE